MMSCHVRAKGKGGNAETCSYVTSRIKKYSTVTMTKYLQDNLDKLKIDSWIGDLQKIGLLGTSRILRKVRDS